MPGVRSWPLAYCWRWSSPDANWWGDFRTQALIDQLVSADIAQVPSLIERINRSRRWADPELVAKNADESLTADGKLHIAMALAPVDDAERDYLRGQLLTVTPRQFPFVRDVLAAKADGVIEPLWGIALDSEQPVAKRFQAACAWPSCRPTRLAGKKSTNWSPTG